MRVLILSDIHGNLPALTAVLADAEQVSPFNQVWCLGDTLGYGADPSPCLALVREKATLLLAGNHDLGAVGKVGLEWFNPHAAAACRWTGQQLTQEERDFVACLPAKLEHPPFTLAHGSPREPVWEYVLSAEAAQACFHHFETPYCLVGHSHIPFVCPQARGGQSCGFFQLPLNTPLELGEERLIMNPGSVGQPRDGDPRASYLVYDDAARTLLYRRTAYDIPAAQKGILKAGLPAHLAERLGYGL